MEKQKKAIFSVVFTLSVLSLGLIAWSPWITEDYAYKRVEDHLGGPETSYNYLGQTMLVRDVPKTFIKLPFISLVYFPSEAMYIVTFFGLVI